MDENFILEHTVLRAFELHREASDLLTRSKALEDRGTFYNMRWRCQGATVAKLLSNRAFSKVPFAMSTAVRKTAHEAPRNCRRRCKSFAQSLIRLAGGQTPTEGDGPKSLPHSKDGDAGHDDWLCYRRG